MVLDEATSSLDLGTELLIEQALDRLMEGRTVIVIAHRLTTAERADRVAVCDEGRLVELGTHAELLAKGGRYAARQHPKPKPMRSRPGSGLCGATRPPRA